MKNATGLVQQGDVLFFKMTALPENLKPKKFKDRVVFAEGEVTGHAHVTALDEFIDVFEDENSEMWAVLEKTREVTHEEHGTVTLDPGIYKIGIVREVDPFADEIRQVAD